MWSFIKQVFASFFAICLALLLLIGVLLAIAASSSSGSKPVSINENSVLHLEFNRPIVEYEKEDPFENFDIPFRPNEGAMGLVQILECIHAAKKEDKIKGILIEMNSLDAGYAVIDEIRQALLEFRKSGKFVVAYGETFSENAYYLASAADKVILNPSGLLEFNGLQYAVAFFKGTFEKLEIEPQVFRVGEYKSAVEPFLLDKMSEANKKQSLSFLRSMNNYHIQQIAESRNISEEKLNKISDSMLVHNAADAMYYKLVTDTLYYDQVVRWIKQTLKVEEDQKVSWVSYGKYKAFLNDPKVNTKNKVAVLIAQGDIILGKGDEESVCSDDITDELKKLREDDAVKAVVLRINSPGGSALASDIIWREIERLKEKKTVVASMSDVAASGGYYIAMPCHKIVADKNSITGSIGVFGLILNTKDFFKNKLGITFDGVKTGKFSDLNNGTRPLSDFEKLSIQNEVNRVYEVFVKKAAKGRSISVDSLKKLASGRVWSGLDAAQTGLVDTLGGLNTAIALASQLAKLDSGYTIHFAGAPKSFFEKLMENFNSDAKLEQQLQRFGISDRLLKTYQKLYQMQGIQARLWPGLEIE